MAAKKQQARTKKSSPDEGNKWSNEIVGIALIGIGLLLLLSLIRYTPGDLPVFGMFSDFASGEEANNPRANLIGPLGTVFGFVQLMLLGAAAYFIPLALVWFGVVRLVFDGKISLRTLLGAGGVLLTAACLLQVFGWFTTWVERYHLPGSGGIIGYGLGKNVFKAMLGSVGSAILLIMAYIISFITMTGLHPVKFIKASGRMLNKVYLSLKEKYQSRGSSSTKSNKPVAQKTTSEETKPKGRKKKTDKVKEEAEKEEDPQSELPLQEVPTPQIIDAAHRKTPVADIGNKLFERPKRSEFEGGLSTDGFEDYELPGFDLLQYDDEVDGERTGADKSELMAIQKTIVDTLKAFGVEVTPGDITHGPTITRYEVYPSIGLRVSRITQLEADIARATRAERINILAPIPGKDTVGIEIANDEKVAVPLRELLQDESFRSAKKKIPLALGKDVYGNTVIGDLAAMPHLLVAGATGSGKSVCINSIITSILFKFGPDELRFIMVDPKVVEMQVYSKLPHLVVPVVTDPKKVVAALRWTVNEMERRYKIFAKEGVRNFDSFNDRVRPEKEAVAEEETPEVEEEVMDQEQLESIAEALESGELGPEPEVEEGAFGDDEEVPDRLPYIVVIIDELADLMQTAPADVEMNIARIAQKARAAGIHLIVATQTPRADVVTGIIKANIPSRIAFQVSSALDSRVILDTKGAEKLVGKGDMLFLPPGSAKLDRAQGAFVSDEEVEDIVKHCAEQGKQRFEESVQASIDRGGDDTSEDNDVSDADEELIQRCMEVIIQEQKASTSLLQRRLRLGYTRAARMIDILEQRGVIGPGEGAKPRDILIK